MRRRPAPRPPDLAQGGHFLHIGPLAQAESDLKDAQDRIAVLEDVVSRLGAPANREPDHGEGIPDERELGDPGA